MLRFIGNLRMPSHVDIGMSYKVNADRAPSVLFCYLYTLHRIDKQNHLAIATLLVNIIITVIYVMHVNLYVQYIIGK